MQGITHMEDTALARHAEKLYSALRACGDGWHGRADIAERLGRPRLGAFDAAALD